MRKGRATAHMGAQVLTYIANQENAGKGLVSAQQAQERAWARSTPTPEGRHRSRKALDSLTTCSFPTLQR